MATLFATVTLLLLGLCDARSLSVPSSERRTTCLMPPQPLLALRGGSSLEQIHTEDELDVVLDEARDRKQRERARARATHNRGPLRR